MIKKSEAKFTSVISAGGSRWKDPQNTITGRSMLKHEVWLGATEPDPLTDEYLQLHPTFCLSR